MRVNGRKNIIKERKKKQESLIETKSKRQRKGKNLPGKD